VNLRPRLEALEDRVVPTFLFHITGDIAGQPLSYDGSGGPLFETYREGLPVNETVTVENDNGLPFTVSVSTPPFNPPVTGWPPGVTAQVNGNVVTISGTPAPGTAGGYYAGLDADFPGDSAHAAERDGLAYRIAVLPPLISFSPGTAVGTGIDKSFTGTGTFPVGVASSLTVTASGGEPGSPPTVSFDSPATSLPPGISVQVSGSTATLSGTPDPGTAGVYSLGFSASSGQETNTDRFILTVTGVSGPVARDDTATTAKNQPVTLNVLANDSNPGGVGFNLTSTTDPSHGKVTLNPGGTVTYTPDTDFTGTDSFQYTITDNNGKTAVATVTVTVSATPLPPPVANNDTATTTENQPVTIDVLANDSDPNGSTPSVTAFSPAHDGTVVLNGGGFVTYTPRPGFVGTDQFTYTITGPGGTATATVTVTVNAAAPMPPVANNDFITTSRDHFVPISVLDNDSDPNGLELRVTSVGQPNFGTTAIDGNTVVYTPVGSVTGPDSFSYTIANSAGLTATATITVNVVDVTLPPVANTDVAVTPQGQAVLIDVLANDSDRSGLTPTVTAFSPAHDGTVVLVGGGFVFYTPRPGFIGTDLFTYTITGPGGTATGTVLVAVGLSQDQAYVAAAYAKLLGREPDTGAYTTATVEMNITPVDAIPDRHDRVVDTISQSDEYRRNQIQDLYRELLNRDPDDGGLRSYLDFLSKGGSLEEVRKGILSSPEYQQKHPDYVGALYKDILKRVADPAGAQFFKDLLAKGGTARQVVDAISGSVEAVDLSIRFAYKSILGREPDPNGLLELSRQVRLGLITLDEVPGKLLESLEFVKSLKK
jgi:hypothetical protein